MTDDLGVLEQTFDIALSETGDAFGFELREGGAKRIALSQDRQPRQARLKTFEAQALEEAALVRHRPSPLLVVIGEVRGIRRRPAANDVRQLRP